jgi:hypothetical protein
MFLRASADLHAYFQLRRDKVLKFVSEFVSDIEFIDDRYHDVHPPFRNTNTPLGVGCYYLHNLYQESNHEQVMSRSIRKDNLDKKEDNYIQKNFFISHKNKLPKHYNFVKNKKEKQFQKMQSKKIKRKINKY